MCGWAKSVNCSLQYISPPLFDFSYPLMRVGVPNQQTATSYIFPHLCLTFLQCVGVPIQQIAPCNIFPYLPLFSSAIFLKVETNMKVDDGRNTYIMIPPVHQWKWQMFIIRPKFLKKSIFSEKKFFSKPETSFGQEEKKVQKHVHWDKGGKILTWLWHKNTFYSSILLKTFQPGKLCWARGGTLKGQNQVHTLWRREQTNEKLKSFSCFVFHFVHCSYCKNFTS